MKRLLIVNADDCNLTPGVTRSILDCHDRGILSSTTFMINLPVTQKTIQEVKKRKGLGVGIHLNVTLGKPVSNPSSVTSLLDGDIFKKVGLQRSVLPKEEELIREYQNQINLFRKMFGRKPTHVDTHHQMHDHPFFYKALKKIARHNDIPMRRSALMRSGSKAVRGIQTTDHLLGDLTPEGHWRKTSLTQTLKTLPEGISEIMCHPGILDKALRKITSFTTGRVVEYKLFRSSQFRKMLSRQGIQLTHFGLCYTSN